MSFKENVALFFKPDWRRALLLLAIGILYYYFWTLVTFVVTCEGCEGLYGYPLPFSANFASLFSEQYSVILSMLFFFIDAYIWYLLACEIVLIIDIKKGKFFAKKTKKKEEEPEKEVLTETVEEAEKVPEETSVEEESVKEEPSEQPSSELQPQA